VVSNVTIRKGLEILDSTGIVHNDYDVPYEKYNDSVKVLLFRRKLPGESQKLRYCLIGVTGSGGGRVRVLL
jgi:hypothetical protein